MAYVKNIWVDQDVERPKTYEVTNNQDGSITLTDSFGLVTELGTPVNEVNMNHIEDGIAGCAIRKHNLTETFNLDEWVLGGTGDDEGIYKSLIANNVGNAITDDTKWEKVEMGGGGAFRNIGEIVASTIPLTDAGLHLLDGSLIQGSGIYSDFVDYIAGLYTDDPTANYFAQANGYANITSSGTAISGGDYSGFPVSNAFDGNTSTVWGSSQMGTSVNGNAYIGRSGLTVPVKKVRMYQGYPSSASNYCTDFKFQYSNDGTTWIDIDTVTNGADKTWQEWILPDFTPSGSTYSFRVLANGGFTGGASNNWTVGELQLYRVATAEESWEEEVTTYGVCGKFVYDSVNNTVRLPKYSNKIYTQELEDTAPVAGNGMTLGLTNGTNNYGLTIGSASNGDLHGWGSAYGQNTTTSGTYSGDSSVGFLGVTSDPTKSGIIAQLSDITTSLDGYYYIVIATSTKTDIQVDIDEIATDLNGKVDKADLAEVQCIVESYVNGLSGYNVYSNGLCEQWGYVYTNGVAGSSTVTFLKPYANINYDIMTCPQRGDLSYVPTAIPFVVNTGSMQIGSSVYTVGYYWRTIGYMAV